VRPRRQGLALLCGPSTSPLGAMTEPTTRAVPRFSWWGLFFAATCTVAICSWEAWRHYRTSGHLDPLYALFAAWTVSYMTARWRSLRQKEAAGTFSEEQWRANPFSYFAGSDATTIRWIGSLFIAVMAWAVWSALRSKS
jgi:hypothetical protein